VSVRFFLTLKDFILRISCTYLTMRF
jgi:hypothetical protein